MFKSKKIDPREINLDKNNPRFSLFNFKSEKDVIDYLFEYEGIKPLALQIIKNGYITLGERLVVLESEKNDKKIYTVLEGNRRVAALKIIFTDKKRFSTSDRKKIDSLNIEDFFVDCDIVVEEEKDEALFKITAKHIDGIKEWNSTDKRVFYDNLYTQHILNGMSKNTALAEIEKITPESKSKIVNALRNHRFLTKIHEAVKLTHPELKELSHLDSDVLTSRVQRRIKKDLDLSEDENYYFVPKKGKEKEFEEILTALGKAAWINKTLNTRTFSTQNMWEKILDEDKIIPELKTLIANYQLLKKESKPELEKETEQVEEIVEEEEKDQLIEEVLDINNRTIPIEKETEKEKNRKYKLFIRESYIEVSDFNYELTNNIEILDEDNNIISKNSSIFEEVKFTSMDENIAIAANKILSLSENGKYIIEVSFFDIKKSYSIFLKVLNTKNEKKEHKDLFSTKWYSDSVALLSSKVEYANIISVLKCLNENKNISQNYDNFIMLAFLIRILVEYSSKAFWDKYYKASNNKPTTLSSYISNISTYLYQNKIITKEEKKSFANGNDLETLNGQIHDYKANISSISIESIFKAYQNYLDKLFLELHK